MEALAFNTLVASRRSVMPQHYNGHRVDDEIIHKMLENANHAPTHKLTQPWHFIVYTRDGLRRLAHMQAEVYRSVTTEDGTFKETRYLNLLEKPMQSSHIIVICMKCSTHIAIPEIEEVGAVFCAVQNMHLTATAYGVAAYLSTGGITYFEEAKSIFGLEKEDRLIGFFNVGMSDKPATTPAKKAYTDFIKWVEA
mgnify:CR=1 FL=1